ncbi:MAG: hypothetical protein KatS3mg105_4684 [Gemmatales bacterium]|nr:MAG: hypothetical protein KatS3mg105_4684 [Gemmatales bacterium]
MRVGKQPLSIPPERHFIRQSPNEEEPAFLLHKRKLNLGCSLKFSHPRQRGWQVCRHHF